MSGNLQMKSELTKRGKNRKMAPYLFEDFCDIAISLKTCHSIFFSMILLFSITYVI